LLNGAPPGTDALSHVATDSNRDLHQMILKHFDDSADHFEKDPVRSVTNRFVRSLVNTYIRVRNINMNARSVDLFNNHEIIVLI
jgi:hypothetical protein